MQLGKVLHIGTLQNYAKYITLRNLCLVDSYLNLNHNLFLNLSIFYSINLTKCFSFPKPNKTKCLKLQLFLIDFAMVLFCVASM